MKKKFIVTAIASLGANVCMADMSPAQSKVTLYGVLDAGARYSTNAGSDATNDSHKSRFQANSGGLMGPRFGIRGSEDLGSGRAAIFTLEGGFNIGTGAISPSGDRKGLAATSGQQRLFSRQAFVGLRDENLGQVTLGRQYTVAFDTAKIFDPSNQINQHGAIYGLNGSFHKDTSKSNSDAFVKYVGTWNDVTLRASLKPGNIAGSLSDGNVYAVGLSYKLDQTELATSYTEINTFKNPEYLSDMGKFEGQGRVFNAGVSHQIGNTTLKMGYSNSSAPTFITSDLTETVSSLSTERLGLGLQHQLNPKVNVILAAYTQVLDRDFDSQGYKYLTGSTYKLSNRTSLYAFVDYTQDPLGSSEVNSESNTRLGITTGITHSF